MNVMLLAALLAMAPPPTRTAPPRPVETPDILVTSQSLPQTEAALRACVARHCPPNEDIDATLAHAENLLAVGRYHDARKALRKSLGRNRDEARRFPVPVSDLYRADGRVAAHLGLDHSYFSSTIEIVRSLKKGLPKDDYRLYGARMEVAAMLGRTQGHEFARAAYARLARDARKNGRPDVAAMAELRSILNHYPPDMRAGMIREIAASQDPQMRGAVLEARLALINIARAEGNMEEVRQLTRELSGLKINRPVLIYSPPYEFSQQEITSPTDILASAFAPTPQPPPGVTVNTRFSNAGAFSQSKRMAANYDDMWIDVGFWVTPEGKVADLKILRKKGDGAWTKPLLKSIAGRLYTPGNGNALDSYRVERYTYTSGFGPGTGSHVAQRSPQARVEYLDLSDDGLSTPN